MKNKYPNICLYFQVHQPYRLRDLRMKDIGTDNLEYFDDEKNKEVFRKVAQKCYLPANKLMLELLKKYPDFSIAYSISGTFLDQCKLYGPDVLASFKKLAKTGKVEFLAETYYHSLSSLKSIEEFVEQVSDHSDLIEKLFGQRPKVFRNTELIYSNELANIARLMGFEGILSEGADHLLKGENPNDVYVPPSFSLPNDIQRIVRKKRPHQKAARRISVLLKNYRLSDDVAFRFSDKTWIGYPLCSDTFTDWITQTGGTSVNLFMDYETFGEHQWADTGIFDFLRSLPEIWKEKGIRALTPSQVIAEQRKKDPKIFDSHEHISWADMERDLSAWQENDIQKAALDALFELEPLVKQAGNEEFLEQWRKLQTSDHFYYMCTKYWNDGDVHKYFSPYDSPYEAYRRFSHALCDLKGRLNKEA